MDSWFSRVILFRPLRSAFCSPHISSNSDFNTSNLKLHRTHAHAHAHAFTHSFTVDAWKHRFTSECLSIVHDQVFGARTPSYSTIMELDKRVRNYYVPPLLQVPGFGSSHGYTLGSVSLGSSSGVTGTGMNGQEAPSMALTMQRHIILAIKEVCKW